MNDEKNKLLLEVSNATAKQRLICVGLMTEAVAALANPDTNGSEFEHRLRSLHSQIAVFEDLRMQRERLKIEAWMTPNEGDSVASSPDQK